MTTLREAAQQALEAMEFMADEWGFTQKANRPERWRAIDALRAALAGSEWREHAPEYEKGFIDGMSEQARRSVDRFVNAMAAPISDNRAQKMRDAGYTRRPTIREMAEPVQEPVEPAYKLAYKLIGCVQHDCEECQRRTQRPAEPEQEPVAWRTFDGEGGYDYRTHADNEDYAAEWAKRNPQHVGWVEPLYTAPPRREWRGLTEEDIWTLAANSMDSVLGRLHFARAIEARLKEKNHE
jgi:hypothetical protein